MLWNYYCLRIKKLIESSCAEIERIVLFNDYVNILWFYGKENAILIWEIGGMKMTGEDEVFRIIPFSAKFPQKKSHMSLPGIGPGPSWWEAYE